MQTKKQSFIETLTNTFVGFVFSLCLTFIVMPSFGFESTPVKNLGITAIYTVASILRGYVLRRWFNKKSYTNKLPNFKHTPAMPPKFCSKEQSFTFHKELLEALDKSTSERFFRKEYLNEPLRGFGKSETSFHHFDDKHKCNCNVEPIGVTDPNYIVIDDIEEPCLVTCEACRDDVNIEASFTDAGDNYFCPGCWKELKPVLGKEYKELVANGEIEES
ncbi:DUF7220 family protein [Wenyingzhuangia aestuarii]|uniref:DUF7220 family protein n=1 Tax=Wenyingzhuangia aestuarii TaxID=1647582 RepID=UPI001ADCC430|nr:hypothetical protein [Wenyingzhuangia aestuarii]NJB83640.1 hypothetical protein [Wenyingzhuangia aestuarii]